MLEYFLFTNDPPKTVQETQTHFLTQPSWKKRHFTVANEKNQNKKTVENKKDSATGAPNSKVKFEIYGEEMI